MSDTISHVRTLTANDRCDRCGAQAYVAVKLLSSLELLFCGHHFAENEVALREAAAQVIDERVVLSPST